MGSDISVRLDCLLFANDHDELESQIRACAPARVVPACAVTDKPVKLSALLESTAFDVVIIAVEAQQKRLPECLNRYPEIPVVVVTPNDNPVQSSFWIEHGASDVLPLDCEPDFMRGLGRVLRECGVVRELASTKQQLAEQTSLRQVVLDAHQHAMMLWQDSSIRQSNSLFEQLMHCTEHAALTLQWRRWMSAETAHLLDDMQAPNTLQTIITSADKLQYKAIFETVMLDDRPARLVQIDPNVLNQPEAPTILKDVVVSASSTKTMCGLPTRTAFTENLQVWLRALQPHARFVAMSIRLPDVHSQSGSKGIGETLQDLLVYRAGILLAQNAGRSTVLGRSDHRSVLLVQLQNKTDARSNALSIRALLGSLGGLIDSPSDISIKTLTSSAAAMGAYEIIWRLESRQPGTTRLPTIAKVLTGKPSMGPSGTLTRQETTTTPQRHIAQFAHPTVGA